MLRSFRSSSARGTPWLRPYKPCETRLGRFLPFAITSQSASASTSKLTDRYATERSSPTISSLSVWLSWDSTLRSLCLDGLVTWLLIHEHHNLGCSLLHR